MPTKTENVQITTEREELEKVFEKHMGQFPDGAEGLAADLISWRHKRRLCPTCGQELPDDVPHI
jgi:hypothetical protein